MLTELHISNFAVIDSLSLEFSPGFQVLTGETGAGKSIIIDAIALLVGGRASTDQIRAGADEAVLEAAFSLPEHGPLAERLRELGLLHAGQPELIIRRILSRSGRHRLYLNGGLSPLHVVQGLAGTLIDIHGQHEQQSLLSPQAQLEALDAFACLKPLSRECADQYARWQGYRRELEEAEHAAREAKAREDLLRFQHRELADANLQPDEEQALTAERHRLMHARRIEALRREAYESLYGGEASALASLGIVSDRLRQLRSIDPEAAEWGDLYEGPMVQLRELAQRLRAYGETLDHDPDRLAKIEERLDQIQRLKKKYGGTMESVLATARELARRLNELETADTKTAELRAATDKELNRLRDLARRLSDRRRDAARKLEMRVKTELAALRMEQTQFRIVVREEDDTPGPTGCNRVEYLLSANPGEPLMPLAKVASGGELSRIMLALKTVLAETDGVPILIFDEVDAGIGGSVASVMGRRLRALGNYHQVFCITHLPQIASQADTHFLVEKCVTKKRTVTQVKRLSREERRDEIARMLGGLAITKAVRETAAEMIEEANRER